MRLDAKSNPRGRAANLLEATAAVILGKPREKGKKSFYYKKEPNRKF